MYTTDLQYFPNLIYIFTLLKARSIIFSGERRYEKGSFLNKMELAGSNGALKLSIPIKGGRSVALPYKEVQIDYKTDWQTNHLRTISSIYGNAPFYPFYENDIRVLYGSKVTNLFQWNLQCFDFFLRKAKMSNLIQYQIENPVDQPTEKTRPILTTDAYSLPPYSQVFGERIGFIPNMSCLDLLMNLGPDTATYMNDCLNKLP